MHYNTKEIQKLLTGINNLVTLELFYWCSLNKNILVQLDDITQISSAVTYFVVRKFYLAWKSLYALLHDQIH